MPDPVPWVTSFVAYALLMRVPLLTGAALFFLPFIAQQRKFCALLLGMFDITPLSTVAVILAAMSTAGIVCDNAQIIYMHAFQRGMGGLAAQPFLLPPLFWRWLMLILTMPVICFSIVYSHRQNPRLLKPRLFYAALAIGAELLAQRGVVQIFSRQQPPWPSHPQGLLIGYEPWSDHVTATAGLLLALAVYGYLGWFRGFKRLGQKTVVPSLCSLLMILMLGCAVLSAFSFFLDRWHVPLLLLLAAWGALTAQSRFSDHYYVVGSCAEPGERAATAYETVKATKPSQKGRIIVVAANGGGIQAGAWAALVLEALTEHAPGFRESLRLISSVSGGSVGSVCYVYKQMHPEAQRACISASRSSLDEVAWGVSWPDLISSVCPWITGRFVGRGRALELAWMANVKAKHAKASYLNQPLSEWNAPVKSGDLPAVILNATLVECGKRLLLGTTRFSKSDENFARMDAAVLHGPGKDVAAVTAARLSASFPYVTPAARSNADGVQPHVVDGGYYDNYGMATLVEWLDEALSEDFSSNPAESAVKSVLVLQIHGAPVRSDMQRHSSQITQRGWFFQTFAPLLAMMNVRGASQIAHNRLELIELQERWRGTVPIHTVTMEFPDTDAPLSWHLTPLQRKTILKRWLGSDAVNRGRRQINSFLAGSDSFGCGCPTCSPLTSSSMAEAVLKDGIVVNA